MDDLEEMARRCFGYGRWEAPYWFIGIEEGISGTLDNRIRAWRKHNKDGLSDCKAFHHEIQVFKHHREPPDRKPPALEPTWRIISLLLLTYLERSNTQSDQREYQATRLGMADGETTLLELFGLPVRDIKLGMAQRGRDLSESEVEQIHDERISTLRQRILDYEPRLVVMFGSAQRDAFTKLVDRKVNDWAIFQNGPTLMTFTPHATTWGLTNDWWIEHARKLRKCAHGIHHHNETEPR